MTSAAPKVVEVKEPQVGEKAELNISRPKAWGWFLVVFFIYFLDMADRGVLTAALPVLKPLWKLTDTQIGLIGVPGMLAMAILVIPSGYLVDKWSRKYMTTIMVTIWSAASWSRAWAQNATDLAVAGTFLMAGEAGYNPAGYSLLGAWFPQKQRGRVIGLFNMAQALGAFGGLAVAGYILANYGWQAIFGVFAIPGFIFGLIMIFAPDYKAKKVDASGAQVAKVSYKEVLKYVGGSPTLIALYVFQVFVYIWSGVFGGWITFYFIRYFKLDAPTAAVTAGLIGLLACLGAPSIGALSDFLTRRYVNGRIRAAMISVVLYTFFWSLSILTGYAQGPLLLGVGFWVCAHFCMAGQWGTVVTAVMDIMPPPYRAIGQSFIPVGQYAILAVSGLVTGMLSDALGLINTMSLLLYVSSIPCVLLLIVAWRNYARDLAKCKACGQFEMEQR
jgi:MFS transporter, Spinster family, sphingosine-1-phosphate transporter